MSAASTSDARKRSIDWRAERDAELVVLEDSAEALLLDRCIVAVTAVPHMDECDSPNVLRLALDDGSVVDIIGGYGGYSGRSCDEYIELIGTTLYKAARS